MFPILDIYQIPINLTSVWETIFPVWLIVTNERRFPLNISLILDSNHFKLVYPFT